MEFAQHPLVLSFGLVGNELGKVAKRLMQKEVAVWGWLHLKIGEWMIATKVGNQNRPLH